MNTPFDYFVGAIALLVSGAFGLGALYLGANWIRLLSYEITSTYLELRIGNLVLRRVKLTDIQGARIRIIEGNLLQVAWFFAIAGRLDAEAGGAERWGNRWTRTFVILRKRGGGRIAMTPADPEGFIAHLETARRNTPGPLS